MVRVNERWWLICSIFHMGTLSFVRCHVLVALSRIGTAVLQLPYLYLHEHWYNLCNFVDVLLWCLGSKQLGVHRGHGTTLSLSLPHNKSLSLALGMTSSNGTGNGIGNGTSTGAGFAAGDPFGRTRSVSDAGLSVDGDTFYAGFSEDDEDDSAYESGSEKDEKQGTEDNANANSNANAKAMLQRKPSDEVPSPSILMNLNSTRRLDVQPVEEQKRADPTLTHAE